MGRRRLCLTAWLPWLDPSNWPPPPGPLPQAARACFGSAADPPEDQHTHTLGLLACGLVSAAAAAFALEECAHRHMLHTFTGQWLAAQSRGRLPGSQLVLPAAAYPTASCLPLLSGPVAALWLAAALANF